MLDIYYNVSGGIMEILQFLLSFLFKDASTPLKDVLTKLKDNNFDIIKTLQNIDLSAILPLIEKFMQFSENKNRSENFQERNIVGLNPIAQIADKDIVYSLNKYFYSN